MKLFGFEIRRVPKELPKPVKTYEQGVIDGLAQYRDRNDAEFKWIERTYQSLRNQEDTMRQDFENYKATYVLEQFKQMRF